MNPTCESPCLLSANDLAHASLPPLSVKKAFWPGTGSNSTTRAPFASRQWTQPVPAIFFTPASFSASCRAGRCSASSTSPVPPPPSTAPPSAPAAASSPSAQSSTSSPPAPATLPLASLRTNQQLPQVEPPPTQMLSCLYGGSRRLSAGS